MRGPAATETRRDVRTVARGRGTTAAGNEVTGPGGDPAR